MNSFSEMQQLYMEISNVSRYCLDKPRTMLLICNGLEYLWYPCLSVPVLYLLVSEQTEWLGVNKTDYLTTDYYMV